MSSGWSPTAASNAFAPSLRRRPRASRSSRSCRTPLQRSASVTATRCARCSFRPATASEMTTEPLEVNFDGLPGPTHNYSGLAIGNVASERNKYRIANPRQAALQGLAKMKALVDRGFAQGVLPPHERPDIAALRALGFAGTEKEVL